MEKIVERKKLMNILVINSHWNNRGDESAIRAMADQFLKRYPESSIIIHSDFKLLQFPDNDDRFINKVVPFGSRKNVLDMYLTYLTKGKVALVRESKDFYNLIKWADIVLHAPGGPSLGETYAHAEGRYWRKFKMVNMQKKPYFFYAPSMGPFIDKKKNKVRKNILEKARLIITREGVSGGYAKGLVPDKEVYTTMDSAFQGIVDEKQNAEKLEEYKALYEFLNKYERVVGITITDLKWHPVHGKNPQVEKSIRDSFKELIDYLNKKGYGVVFIPQLFGTANDKILMESFARENCFTIDDEHDCYFQQYVIGRIYSVIGLRYHSNIFSAKMKTPFISVSYEQKMKGFMEQSNLSDLCIDLKDLSPENLIRHFEYLENNYDKVKERLSLASDTARDIALKTTELIGDYIDKNM